MSQTQNQWYSTGKRKTAIARVYLTPGTGQIVVNGKDHTVFFGRATSRMVLWQPLELIEATDKYDVVAHVCGGGESGQADAIKHGISKALLVEDPERRLTFKRAGFLTRDARKKERKKYGQPGARKRFQFSKR